MDGTTSFGGWLRRRRKAMDITQAELARHAGCVVGTIKSIEADVRRPSRQLAERLADHLALGMHERVAFLKAARGMLVDDQISEQPIVENSLPITGALPAGMARQGNLPARLTALIGRTHELGELSALLRRADVRLVTLTGPGGSGKTRLALQLATVLRDRYPDGAWFVDLSLVIEPVEVGAAVALGLGLPESSQSKAADVSAAWDRLARVLSSKQLLLVLDNFEQVVDAAPQLARLLRAAPGIQAIVTSRAALRLAGEYEYPVAPLSLPVIDTTNNVALIGQLPAILLFMIRAQAARPGFALTSDNAEDIVAICRTLDGLPLALELAAARVRLFAPQELRVRLECDGGLGLLTSGARDRPFRQQTIRATIAWSYDLLGLSEQRLFARLGVLVGSWTIELAEGVCAPYSDTGVNVLDGLQVLIEHSLIQMVASTDHIRTFRMLETVRAFALERLRTHEEEAPFRTQHLATCVALAEAAEPQLRSPTQMAWFSRLDSLHENLRAALIWGLEAADANLEQRTLGLRLAVALWYYWFMRGHILEAHRWLEHPAIDDERLPLIVRTRALLSHWFIVSIMSGDTSSLTSGARGLALARLGEDPVPLAQALLWSGDASDRVEGWELAQRISDTWWHTFFFIRHAHTNTALSDQQRHRMLTLARATGDRMLISRALFTQINWHLVRGELALAQQFAEERLSLERQFNHKHGIAETLFFHSRILDAQGDTDSARTCQEERYDLEHLLDNSAGYTITLLDSARLAIWQSEYQQAVAFSTRVDTNIIQSSIFLSTSAAWTASWLALEQGHPEIALAYVEEARAGIRAAPRSNSLEYTVYLDGCEVALIWLVAAISLSLNEPARAAALYEESLLLLQALPTEQQQISSFYLQFTILSTVGATLLGLSGIGRLASRYDDPVVARNWLATVMTIIRTTTGLWETTINRAVWGRAHLGWGDYPAAAAQLADDLRFYQRAGARRAIAESLEGLATCACGLGEQEKAVCWWGAAAFLRSQIGAPMWQCDRPDYERWLADARTALGTAIFDEIWASGYATPWQQAVTEALALYR